jgi:hypothetical protein
VLRWPDRQHLDVRQKNKEMKPANHASIAPYRKALWLSILVLGLTAHAVFADLSSGLVAYYPFNGSSNDESGHGNHGTVVSGAFVNDRFGIPNRALKLTGAANMFTQALSSNFDYTNSLTISVWVNFKTLSSASYPCIAGIYNQCGSWEASLVLDWRDQQKIKASEGVSCLELAPILLPQTPQANRWYHLVLTHNQGNLAFYVDGNLVGTTNYIPNVSYSSGSHYLRLGNPDSWGQLDGIVDDVRIYDRALSSQEVTILSQNPAVPLPPQKIFLAFDQPSSFRLVVVPLAFGRSWPIVEPFGSMPAATVDATYRASVTAQVKNIFSRSGVSNIDWVATDSDDAIAVYFCPLTNPDILGYSRGAPDRFNSKRRGEVIVFVNESSPLANLDAESAAHEIGHSLGLRHVDPSAADPLNNEVMDLDFSSDPQFTNTISDITDITSFATHNPRYHLLRYIDGWSSAQLQNESIEPGTWDSGTSVFTKLSFQGANLRLHNITLYASGGDVESTFVLDQISSATLSELSQRSFTIPKGMKVTLLASSAEGGPPDVISATGDPFVGENQHVAVDAATTPFSLYRQDSPTVAVPIASATADSDLTTPFCNLSLTQPNILRLDFRGTLQQSTNLSDWSDIGLDATSPHFVVIPPGQSAGFFRSKQPATP